MWYGGNSTLFLRSVRFPAIYNLIHNIYIWKQNKTKHSIYESIVTKSMSNFRRKNIVYKLNINQPTINDKNIFLGNEIAWVQFQNELMYYIQYIALGYDFVYNFATFLRDKFREYVCMCVCVHTLCLKRKAPRSEFFFFFYTLT